MGESMIIHLTFSQERLNFCIPSLRKVKIWPDCSKEEIKNVKKLQKDNNDDDRQQIDFD